MAARQNAKTSPSDPAQRILHAAHRAMRDGDSIDFSMRQIAADASISLRTVYEHFPSRDDLVLALYSETMRTLASEVVPVVELCPTVEEKLRLLVTLTVIKVNGAKPSQLILRERQHLATVRPDGVRDALTPLRNLVVGIIEDRPARPDNDDPSLLADIVLTTLMSHCHALSGGMFDATPQDLAKTLAAYIGRGVGLSMAHDADARTVPGSVRLSAPPM